MKAVTDRIPARVKAPLRKLKTTIVEHKRRFGFDRAMGGFARAHDPALIPQLIDSWGNAHWSALDEYLSGCIRAASDVRADILECGSGLSTILLGVVAQRNGVRVCTLEHSELWADKVRFYLARYRIHSVSVFCNPLRAYDGFEWYDPPLQSLPSRFALAICDGPPTSTTQGGRYGLMPLMSSRLKGSTILLDDAQRPEEQEIARRWSAEYGASYLMEGVQKSYFRMSIPAD